MSTLNDTLDNLAANDKYGNTVRHQLPIWAKDQIISAVKEIIDSVEYDDEEFIITPVILKICQAIQPTTLGIDPKGLPKWVK